MFRGIKSGWQLIYNSLHVFNRHPKLMTPLLVTWLFYAAIIIYLQFFYNEDSFTGYQSLIITFGVIFVFTFLLSFSCSVLLELIEQLETGKEINIPKAFKYTLRNNTFKIIPIVLVWTVVWFLLFIIQVLLSKNNNKNKSVLNAERAAKTLAGSGKFSLSTAFFKGLEKGMRMIVFLILPAIAWGNLSFWNSVKKGWSVYKSNLSTFATGFVLTGFANFLIFLPPTIIIYFSTGAEIVFPDWVWFTTIVYIAFAWSYSMYLEQMFTAELYLWNLKWEKEVKKAKAQNKPVPKINDIAKPSLLDEVHDLL
jgi:hypothetical protein